MKTTHRTFRMVNDMAERKLFVKTLARAAAALAVSLVTFQAGPAGAQTLVVGDGTNPANVAQLCPSGARTPLDAFTLQATGTADVVSRITVQLAPAGAWVNVATIEITDPTGVTTYGSAIPGGDQTNVYVGSLAVPIGAATSYMVYVTPRSHAAMPAPNIGQSVNLTGTVASVASNNPRTYSDTTSATVTIDNLAPPEIQWTTVANTATSITLNWTAATNVLVLQKQGGPVTESPVEGTASYVAGNTIGGSVVSFVGLAATSTASTLTAGLPYYFEVFTRDSCNNYSLGSPIGPLFPGSTSNNEGSAAGNTLLPVVGILNPMSPATVTNAGAGFRVQVRAFSRLNGATAQPLSAVRLKAATPAQAFSATCDATNYPIALALNANYPNSTAAGVDNHGVYEATVGTAQLGASKGAFTLRACATNGSGTVLSGPVGITVNDGSAGSPKGDGNLLVRDNGGQLCNDCHALATHTSEIVGNKYGSWYADCRACHTPHNTTNIELVRRQITPPGYRGQQPPKTVYFSNHTGAGYNAAAGANSVSSTTFANGDATGVCQVCHTATTHYLANNTQTNHNPTLACTGCHLHSKGFGAGESTGGANCSGCHPTIVAMMTTATNSKHSLVGWTDTFTDANGAWGTANPLSTVAPAARSCVNMCHSDHPHTLTTPATATHEFNLYLDPSSTATRNAASSTNTTRNKTDFSPSGNTGMCTKCHSRPIATGGLVIADATYGASAHDFTSTAAPNATWSYGLHDGSTFLRNCTKCHASATEGTTPTVTGTTGLTAVHGQPNPDLLAGTKRPAGVAAGFVCYNCHGSAAPVNGAQGNRSNKNIQAQIAKTSNHPSTADSSHDTVAESTNAIFGNTLGVTGRHSSCMDCHDTHGAKAGTHAVTTNVAGPPLQGAWGAKLSTNPAFWAATNAISFTKTVIAAGTDLEATLCFKCHSSYYGALPASPSGGYTETDTAKEFNPANVGNYAGAWASGETAGGFHPVLATSANNLGAINMANLVTTNFAWRTNGARNLMTCTDCHESETPADPNGPHGSTAGFILRGPNTTWSQAVLLVDPIPAGTFCLNCHQNTFTNSRYPDHNNGSHANVPCWNCHARVPHGGPRPGMLVAGAGAAAAVGGTIAGWDTASPYWGGTTADRLYLASYPANNTTNWSQNNCGCNGTGH